MPDTDRLVAAIFSATMNARDPTAEALLAQYEYFLKELPARRSAEQRKAEEHDNAAWSRSAF
jgi:hypothetical protein